MAEATRAAAPASSAMGNTKERSSLSSSMGKSPRKDSEPYPRPKPSMEIWIPLLRSRVRMSLARPRSAIRNSSVTSMLEARDLPPGALQLEVTEEFLMADRGRARDILTRLRNSGIQISIDGFGRGYGSLSFLGDLPIDELKLDRSLVFPM